MYRYTRTTDEASPTRLPDCETFQAYPHECRDCGRGVGLSPDYYGLIYLDRETCPECGATGTLRCVDTALGWYFAFLDGGLDCFSSDPSGPYPSEAAALAAAREDAGVCPHGCGDDEPCIPCDHDESCHSDGSTCPDGCDATPNPERLAAYREREGR